MNAPPLDIRKDWFPMCAQFNSISCVCAICHKSFLQSPSRIKKGRGKYCSKACKCSPLTRLWSRVDREGPGGCWLWTGYLQSNGYGQLKRNRKTIMAHRLSYELSFGCVPDGFDIHHRCNNRACVNPSHLQALSRREHLLIGNGFAARCARKTHCPHGHPYDSVNTMHRKDGSRRCRICSRSSFVLWKARKHSTAPGSSGAAPAT